MQKTGTGGDLLKAELLKEKRTADKIVGAATELFARKGFAAVSVKELADAAGVNIALISYYFGGKENLYTTVLERQFAIMADVFDTIKREGLSPIERVRRFACMMVKMHKKAAYANQLIYSERLNPTGYLEDIVKKEIARIHNFLKDCINEAIAAGQFRTGLDPDCAALTLGGIIRIHFCTQPFLRELLPSADDRIEYYVAQAIDIYLRGVQNPSLSSGMDGQS